MASWHGGEEFKVHRRFEDIMSRNYGRNPFVQKNEGYRFKFRGEDVCITLYNPRLHHETLYTRVNVGGKGGEQWWKEASPILEKQLERILSRDQEQGAKTGENKKPLVSEEEFRDNFAIPNVYGTHVLPWPRSTILLYKYSSNATNKYWEIPEDTWKKIVNNSAQHAELIMIEDLKNIQDYLIIQPDEPEGSFKTILNVEVILSYSPCVECSQGLCLFKEKMDEKVNQSKIGNKQEEEEEEKVEFKITFSNFYNHTEERNGKYNIEGLKYLLRRDIKLDVFSDDNWHYFFNAAGLVTQRQKRERDDKKILQYLEGLVTSERIEQDLWKNKLL